MVVRLTIYITTKGITLSCQTIYKNGAQPVVAEFAIFCHTDYASWRGLYDLIARELILTCNFVKFQEKFKLNLTKLKSKLFSGKIAPYWINLQYWLE